MKPTLHNRAPLFSLLVLAISCSATTSDEGTLKATGKGKADGHTPEATYKIGSTCYTTLRSKVLDALGARVATPGDITGDGLDDLVVSAPRAEEHGLVYVFEGPVPPGELDLSTAYTVIEVTEPAYGMRHLLGQELIALRDVSGDGRPDFALSVRDRMAIFFGPIEAGRVAIEDADRFVRGLSDPFFSYSKLGFGKVETTRTATGDFDGDGQLDFVLADHANSIVRIYFQSDGFLRPVTLVGEKVLARNPPGNTTTPSTLGIAVAAGDLNGDGFDDLALSDPGIDGQTQNDVGAVYVYFGPFSNTDEQRPRYDVKLMGLYDSKDVSYSKYLTCKKQLGTRLGYFPSVELGSALTVADVTGRGAYELVVAKTYGDVSSYDVLDPYMKDPPTLDTPSESWDPPPAEPAHFLIGQPGCLGVELVTNLGDLDGDGRDEVWGDGKVASAQTTNAYSTKVTLNLPNDEDYAVRADGIIAQPGPVVVTSTIKDYRQPSSTVCIVASEAP